MSDTFDDIIVAHAAAEPGVHPSASYEDPVFQTGPWKVTTTGAGFKRAYQITTDWLPPARCDVMVEGRPDVGLVRLWYDEYDPVYVLGAGWRVDASTDRLWVGDTLVPYVSRETSEGGESMTWKIVIEGEHPRQPQDGETVPEAHEIDNDLVIRAREFAAGLDGVRSARFEGEASVRNLIGEDASIESVSEVQEAAEAAADKEA
ncbi:MAG TPA: hypothetical protein VFQ40_07470 [Actinomycetota bacterium]|nr:hypothetical protein [Actinomycetota bacterium]